MSFMTCPFPTPAAVRDVRAHAAQVRIDAREHLPARADGDREAAVLGRRHPRAPPGRPRSPRLSPRAPRRPSRSTSTVAVLMSTTVWPARACAMRPSGPKHTWRTCGSPGTQMNTTSARAATSETLAPARTPAPAQSAIRSDTTSYPITGLPDLRARLRHMRPPIVPRPMKPRVEGSFNHRRCFPAFGNADSSSSLAERRRSGGQVTHLLFGGRRPRTRFRCGKRPNRSMMS